MHCFCKKKKKTISVSLLWLKVTESNSNESKQKRVLGRMLGLGWRVRLPPPQHSTLSLFLPNRSLVLVRVGTCPLKLPLPASLKIQAGCVTLLCQSRYKWKSTGFKSWERFFFFFFKVADCWQCPFVPPPSSFLPYGIST